MKIQIICPKVMQLEPFVAAFEKYIAWTADSVNTHFIGGSTWDLVLGEELGVRDVLVYVGAAEGPLCAPPDYLKGFIKKDVKILHVCPDAAHPGWWDMLERYASHDCVTATCFADGVEAPVMRERDYAGWFPISPHYYIGRGIAKTVELGFAGGTASAIRKEILGALGDKVTVMPRNEAWGSYQEYADFMLSCKSVLNIAYTAESRERMHVKNRVYETAMARAFLWETKDSPAVNWLNEGSFHQYPMYGEYGQNELQKISELDDMFKRQQAYRLYRKVMTDYTPQKWWQKALKALF